MGFNRPSAQILSPLLQSLLQTNSLSRDQLSEAVSFLSRLFTKERQSLPADYLGDPQWAAAYRAYFMPVNAAKVQVLLDELCPFLEKDRHDWSVLDIGSGPGTASLAFLDWLTQYRTGHPMVRALAVDRSSDALRETTRLWNAYCAEAGINDAKLSTAVVDLERVAKGPHHATLQQAGPYDLIVMANCLNELFTTASDPLTARTAFVAALVPMLKPRGTLMLMEPALRETSRALHQVRDRLLQEQRCTVYSPCLHEGNCPALVNPFDWCHEERAWQPPIAIQEIDEQVGFIKDALKFSYVLLRKDGKTIVERRPDVYRVVSELRELKGEKRAWLCNETGRPEVGRQDRLASPQNAAVDLWHRGAIVQIEKIVRKEKGGKVSALGRIERDVAVELIRQA